MSFKQITFFDSGCRHGGSVIAVELAALSVEEGVVTEREGGEEGGERRDNISCCSDSLSVSLCVATSNTV